ncbi:MAG: hypothetical protein K940chlam8_01179 [Chlamydiae bacterium]|nr:hypothetical protein [Chlamydiota bacterium]
MKKLSICFLSVCFFAFGNTPASHPEQDVVKESELESSGGESTDGLSREVYFSKDSETQLEKQRDALTTVKFNILGGAILLQGDVRVRYKVFSIKDGPVSLVGNDPVSLIGNSTILPRDAFNNEFNLYLNYVARRFYAKLRLKFSNKMGAQGGTTGKFSLEKAYFGHQVFREGATIVGIEAGRRDLLEMLESKVQFGSRMDGASVYLATEVPKLFEFDLRGILTIVDFAKTHFAPIIQVSFYNISDYGLYVKYAYVDWEKKGTTRIFNGSGNADGRKEMEFNPRYQFRISQWTLGFVPRTKILGKKVRFYGAFLLNHAAKKRALTNCRRENLACYGGFTYGNAYQKGDISLDVNYQYVEAQSVPGFDSSGIGTGNPRENVFYGPAKNDITGAKLKPNQITVSNANGNTNFKGVSASFAYILTRNLKWQISGNYSRRLDGQIGPNRTFKQIDTSLIYSF